MIRIYSDEAVARAVESLWKKCFVSDSLIFLPRTFVIYE